MRFALLAADDNDRFAEIGLCVAGRMSQRHEHLLSAALPFTDVVLDDRVAAGEAVLVAQAVEDALRRVTLLSRLLRIIAQDLIDDPRKGIELRPTPRLAAPVARRDGVAQHLAHRIPRQAEPPGRFAFTQPFDVDTAPYLSV